ncbi:hypothetical protein OC861_005225 [Tilletia horrida]|nr:hypothetical protein OC861_005225 [Tilletia horrida]
MKFAAISSIFVFAAVASAFTGLVPEQETFLKFCTGGACSQDKRQTLGLSAEAFQNWQYQCAVKCSSCVVQNCFAYTDLVAHPSFILIFLACAASSC